MAAQKGRLMLLKRGDGDSTEVFTAIGGFRSNSLSINNEPVEITNKDSAGQRETLSGAGVTSVSVSGSGVFKDDAIYILVAADALANTQGNWQILIPDLGTYTGAFDITSLEDAGEHNGEVTYSIALESAGAITFASV